MAHGPLVCISLHLTSAINGSTTAKEESTYYNYDKEQKLPVYELWDYLTAIYADKCEKLYQEFQVR